MIYLVEDDSSIRELVIYALNSTGLEAKGFEKPSEFWKAVAIFDDGSRSQHPAQLATLSLDI